MSIGFMFLFNSVLLGVGLAMDAFSVSLANGLNEPQMGTRRMCGIAGVFAFFQALMPMTGWVCIHTIVSHFQAFEKLIPWIALVLLLYIGGSMLKEGLAGGGAEAERCGVGFMALFIQGVATSIDALSVGFTIAEYDFFSRSFGSADYCNGDFCDLPLRPAYRKEGWREAGRKGEYPWRCDSDFHWSGNFCDRCISVIS